MSEKKENIAFGDLVYSVFKMSCRGVKKSKDCLGQKKITSFYCQEPKRDGGSEIGSIEGAIEGSIEGAIIGEGSRALLEDSTAPSESVFGESVTIDSQMTGENEGNECSFERQEEKRWSSSKGSSKLLPLDLFLARKKTPRRAGSPLAL